MIAIVEGPPGSGKTLYALEQIYERLCNGEEVWTNIELHRWWPAVVAGRGWRSWGFTSDEIWRRGLPLRRLVHQVSSVSDLPADRAKEGSRLVVVDEAQLFFNCRSSPQGALLAVRWFSQSRKFGCDVLLCAQDHMMIDKQLRLLAEQHVTCWSMARFSIPTFILPPVPVGWLVSKLTGGVLVFRRATMTGMGKAVLWRKFSKVDRKTARLYDTTQVYQFGGESLEEVCESVSGGCGCVSCRDQYAAWVARVRDGSDEGPGDVPGAARDILEEVA